MRLGQIHRNTFVNSPQPPRPRTTGSQTAPRLRLAGQITGVEGYLESAATGLAVGALPGARAARRRAGSSRCPATTALGALARHLTESDPEHFQPANINYGLFTPLEPQPKKDERRGAYAARARSPRSPRWKARCGALIVPLPRPSRGRARALAAHRARLRGRPRALRRVPLRRLPAKPAAEAIDLADDRRRRRALLPRRARRASTAGAARGARSPRCATFFRWACRVGELAANPAQRVRTPKAPQTPAPPPAPGRDRGAARGARGRRADWRSATAPSSSCSTPPACASPSWSRLDWRDLDLKARVLRVVGKGGKERMVPFGRPAQAALRAWRGAGRRCRAARRARPPAATRSRSSSTLRGERLTDRSVRRHARPLRSTPTALAARRPSAHPAPHLRHPPARGAAPTCAPSRSCSATARSPPPSATPTSTSSACSTVYRDAHPRARRRAPRATARLRPMPGAVSCDVALVTYAGLPELDPDDRPLAAALRAPRRSAPASSRWDDPGFDWGFDADGLLRSPVGLLPQAARRVPRLGRAGRRGDAARQPAGRWCAGTSTSATSSSSARPGRRRSCRRCSPSAGDAARPRGAARRARLAAARSLKPAVSADSWETHSVVPRAIAHGAGATSTASLPERGDAGAAVPRSRSSPTASARWSFSIGGYLARRAQERAHPTAGAGPGCPRGCRSNLARTSARPPSGSSPSPARTCRSTPGSTSCTTSRRPAPARARARRADPRSSPPVRGAPSASSRRLLRRRRSRVSRRTARIAPTPRPPSRLPRPLAGPARPPARASSSPAADVADVEPLARRPPRARCPPAARVQPPPAGSAIVAIPRTSTSNATASGCSAGGASCRPAARRPRSPRPRRSRRRSTCTASTAERAPRERLATFLAAARGSAVSGTRPGDHRARPQPPRGRRAPLAVPAARGAAARSPTCSPFATAPPRARRRRRALPAPTLGHGR